MLNGSLVVTAVNGAYAWDAGRVDLPVDNRTSTVIDHRGVPVSAAGGGIYGIAADAGTFVFVGIFGNAVVGGSLDGFGPLERFVDPPSGFAPIENVALRSGQLAFGVSNTPGSGPGSHPGVYYAPRRVTEENNPDDLVLIANQTTPIPGGSGTFELFGHRSASLADTESVIAFDTRAGQRVAFIGHGAGGQEGVYAAVPGAAPQLVADAQMGFSGFCAVAVDGEAVAFMSAGGVFVWRPNQPIQTIAERDTPLPSATDGRFTQFYCGGVAMARGVVAFAAQGQLVASRRVVGGIYAFVNGTLAPILGDGDTVDGDVISGTLAELTSDGAMDERSIGGGEVVVDMAILTHTRSAGATMYRASVNAGLE